MVGVLVLATAGVGGVAVLLHAHRRAGAAADLAALAGAAALVRGEDACAAADRVARSNDAVLLAAFPAPTRCWSTSRWTSPVGWPR